MGKAKEEPQGLVGSVTAEAITIPRPEGLTEGSYYGSSEIKDYLLGAVASV